MGKEHKEGKRRWTIKEDLEFARRTEEAYKRHERGDFIKMDFDHFIKEMKTW